MPTETLLRSPSSVIVAGGGGHVEEVGGADRDVVPQPVDLVRPVAEHRVERRLGDGDEVGMRDPGAVEALRRPRAPCPRSPCASATAFTSGSRREGMKAAMPPIACAPRRWHVLTSSSQ